MSGMEATAARLQPPGQNDEALREFARGCGLDSAAELYRFPKYFQIETSALCNSRCTMCYLNDITRPKGLMRDDLFEHIVAQLVPYADWVAKITIQNLGEPLVDKKLEARIARLKEIGIRMVAFSTNGSLLTPERTASVLASGVDEVSFSVDGTCQETYGDIRVGLDYEKAVGNIIGFIAARDELGAPTTIRLRMLVQEQNAHEYPEFVRLWSARLSAGDSLYGRLLHHADVADLQAALPEARARGDLNARACIGPWGSMIIDHDGRVALCPVDSDAEFDIGNVWEQTIAELWRSPVFHRVREEHRLHGRGGSLPMCDLCNLWDSCSRLPGLRLGA